MSITSSELVWRRPAEVSDLSTNGGRITSTPILSGVKNNLFPNVPQAERVAGSTKYRKVFIHVANDDSLALIAPKVYVLAPTPGDDRVTIFEATNTDTQAAITGLEQQYGAGVLNANATLGATTCQVLVEAAADAIFKNGMTVRISDRQTVDGAGNEQFLTLASDASYSGNVATLTFTATPLAFNFSTTSPTYVSSVLTPADAVATVTDWLLTSALGTFDTVNHPVLPHGIGSIEQLWTLTFTSPTTFTASGDTVGAIGTGTIGTNFVPANSAYSKPYFTLPSAGWGGTLATGNTVQFRTHPAALKVWYKRTVPAGANSLSANKVSVGVDGESE